MCLRCFLRAVAAVHVALRGILLCSVYAYVYIRICVHTYIYNMRLHGSHEPFLLFIFPWEANSRLFCVCMC